MKNYRLIISAFLAITLTAASANNVLPESGTANSTANIVSTDNTPSGEEGESTAAENTNANHTASDFIAEEARLAGINLP